MNNSRKLGQREFFPETNMHNLTSLPDTYYVFKEKETDEKITKKLPEFSAEDSKSLTQAYENICRIEKLFIRLAMKESFYEYLLNMENLLDS